MKVTIQDVEVSSREVDIPEKCPNCDTDLTNPETLRIFQYQNYGYYGELGPEELEMSGSSIAPIIDDILGPVDIWCVKCEHSLVPPKPEVCDECGKEIPADVPTTFNEHHSKTCSLHPENMR